MPQSTAITEINQAEKALERASDIHEMINLRDRASAMQIFADAQGFHEAAQKAKVFQLKAERKAGKWLSENINHKGGDSGTQYHDGTALPEGIDKHESSRWQLESKVPDEAFSQWVDSCLSNGKEITASGLQKLAKNPHVSFNTGETEWYTPPIFIHAAISVMGEIDLDPASNSIANKIIGARKYYTEETNGLNKKWTGRVWMNPPYSTALVTPFIDKFVQSFNDHDISEGIVLVNNATETVWFSKIIEIACAVCFPTGRIKFISPEGELGSPLQGQAIIYTGKNIDRFIEHFGGFGWIARIEA